MWTNASVLACYDRRMSVRELLTDTFAYIPPNRAIEALTSADAERRIAGAPHSVAEIVAHRRSGGRGSHSGRKAEPSSRPAAQVGRAWHPGPGTTFSRVPLGTRHARGARRFSGSPRRPDRAADRISAPGELHASGRGDPRCGAQRPPSRPGRGAPSDDGCLAAAIGELDLLDRAREETKRTKRMPAMSSASSVRLEPSQEETEGNMVAALDVEWLSPSAWPNSWAAMSSM